MLTCLSPFAVIDAAGPFQHYGPDPYAFARQVIQAGVHYLDLADARNFVADFHNLDTLARARGVAALSGASGTPALSAAAADALAEGLTIEAIETTIVPGNRTPRGRSVTEAILGQVGQNFTVTRGGHPHSVTGWSGNRRMRIQTTTHRISRWAALVNTPDLALFPDRYGARDVRFLARQELPLFHHALRVVAWPVRWDWVPSLRPLTGLVHWIAGWFESWGSDIGGMKVRVVGTRPGGGRVRHDWDLIAPNGVGPRIPALPAVLLTQALARRDIAPGARPAVGALTLAQAETALHALGVETTRHSQPQPPLFTQILGTASLPKALHSFHSAFGHHTYKGRARVDGPQGILAAIAGRIAGFPRTTAALAVKVTVDARPDREVWRRQFGTKTFRSTLTQDPKTGQAVERFGPMSFRIALTFKDNEIAYPVTSGHLFGLIPIPKVLLPVSDTREYQDDQGRFCFDVMVSLRTGARIARYRGHLTADQPP